eukprot:2871364-Rhodomonas_salina.1
MRAIEGSFACARSGVRGGAGSDAIFRNQTPSFPSIYYGVNARLVAEDSVLFVDDTMYPYDDLLVVPVGL